MRRSIKVKGFKEATNFKTLEKDLENLLEKL